jgi:nucleoside-diphosphate-sugar epimerase
MRILITGNMGYIGPVLSRHLRSTIPGCTLIGYDSGFFGHCFTGALVAPETLLDQQYYGDVRDVPDGLLAQVDAVVHLAAVSNDPMGSRFEAVTDAINHQASAEIAKRALAQGVKRFVFASSCSMYGFAEGGPKKETDPLNPLTAYARSKVATEQALSQLHPGDATITALRFSTACGMSDRLRLDLVLNDFVACALSSGTITVLSDGSPWRPLIDVKDMSRAIEWALVRDPAASSAYLAVNVGSSEWNYQVKDLANAVAAAVPGTTVSINTNAPPDKRSYMVDFSLFKQVAPDHQPRVTLNQAIHELIEGMQRMNFKDADFRSSHFMRLKVLDSHIESKRLSHELRWAPIKA